MRSLCLESGRLETKLAMGDWDGPREGHWPSLQIRRLGGSCGWVVWPLPPRLQEATLPPPCRPQPRAGGQRARRLPPGAWE